MHSLQASSADSLFVSSRFFTAKWKVVSSCESSSKRFWSHLCNINKCKTVNKKHPTREQSTNQIEIEDIIEPEVFQELLLRFIYTGRVSTQTIETMDTGLLIAADKYLLDDLKNECENYLIHHMSPDIWVVLLLHGDLLNPAEPLKDAAKFLRHFPNQVMATDGWKKKSNKIIPFCCPTFNNSPFVSNKIE